MVLRISSPDFQLAATLDSGQVFGFRKEGKSYVGRIRGADVTLSQDKNQLTASGSFSGSFRDKLAEYFDLNYDLSDVFQMIYHEEEFGSQLKPIKGLRLIRQDSWEALACFIISSNNNVKRIQGIWKNLSERLGGGPSQFPSAERIARSHERILRELGLGYRAPFLQRTACFISHNPKSLEMIRIASYSEAKERLLSFPGIGEKVADCVLLYGFRKLEAFPVDVWILRLMRKLFFKNKPVSEDRVREFGQRRWGGIAGYVQQYLFHGGRMGLIG